MNSNIWVEPSVKLLSLVRNKKEITSFFNKLGVPSNKILFADHHTCHAYATLSNWWGQIDDALILTLDGAGDGYSATVSILEKGEVKPIAKTNLFSSLGLLYSRATHFLGMKPDSHEYKLMGLAAYSKEKYFNPIYEKLKEYIYTNPTKPLEFKNLVGVFDIDYLEKFREDFPHTRFDNFAAAIQKLTEEIMVKWVKNAIRITGKKNVFCSGGVFMNVKANMKLLENINFNRFFIFPSCGDESNAIGAANYGYYLLCKENEIPFRLAKLKSIYWGTEYSNKQIKEELMKHKDLEYTFYKDIEKFSAKEIANGKIIARAKGPMEFGARALGNRSILCDPRKYQSVRKINEAIKMRDFWMPFAGTILDTQEKRYIENPKKYKAPYMMITFRTKEKAHKDLICAIHLGDLTSRPQILEEGYNLDYYRLVKEFFRLTKVGGILNTSFNIHGEPIVRSPADAIDTFKRSKLDALALGNFYVTKKHIKVGPKIILSQ